MCLWRGVSKSGYCEWKDRPLSATAVRQEYLKGKIEEIFGDNDETCGYRRVHAELARQGEQATSELVRLRSPETAGPSNPTPPVCTDRRADSLQCRMPGRSAAPATAR